MNFSNFGIRLKNFRLSLGLNQKQFATELGIGQSTLSSYENGSITPSTDVLLALANKYNISLDWLFGISETKNSISSLSDVIDFILKMNDLNEIRYDLEINDKIFNDLESETEKIYASIKFYGTDNEHPNNLAICQFLSALKETRENFEDYIIDKDVFDYWKKNMLERYSHLPLTQKIVETISTSERQRRQNIALEKRYKQNLENALKKNN